MDLTGSVIRNIAFPLMEKVKGNHIRKNLRELRDSQSISRDELKKLQKDRLRQLLQHSVTHVPAYREFASLMPLIEQDPLLALARFPVLSKDAFREDTEKYFSETADRSQCILNRTGGSTGKPLTFYMDRHTVEYYEAARYRGLSWSNIRIGDPCVMIWGSPIELSQQAQRKQRMKERLLKNRIVIPAFNLRKEQLLEYVKTIESFRPVYIYGWATALALFASFMLEKNIKLSIPLKAVVNTAETLYPHQRELIEQAFSCPVINEYGARDGGIIGYECSHGHLHVSMENAVYEVVDIKTLQPVEPGQKGLILVTDLHNYVMPRLRYQLGDVVAMASEPASCGLTLPVLESIEGRENDTFLALDGSFINGQFFTNVARTLPSIKQFQVVQQTPNEVVLRLVNHEGLKQEDIEAFKMGIINRMGEVMIHVECVNEIAPADSGKVRAAIRNFALQR